nr:bromodomain-containing protein [Tanacetum cinerariifolium]
AGDVDIKHVNDKKSQWLRSEKGVGFIPKAKVRVLHTAQLDVTVWHNLRITYRDSPDYIELIDELTENFEELYKEEVNTLQATLHQRERNSVATAEQTQLTKELHSSCDSIEWQLETIRYTESIKQSLKDGPNGKKYTYPSNTTASCIP